MFWITLFFALMGFVVLPVMVIISYAELKNKPLGIFLAYLIPVCLFFWGWRMAAVSPTARELWLYDNRCLAIKNVLDYIEDNPQQFSIKSDSDSLVRNNIIITDKINGDEHKIYVDDEPAVSYIHWYKNGKLVIRNGYKRTCKREEYLPFGYDTYVAEALNDYIFDELEDILESQKRLSTFSGHGNFELLSIPSAMKTLEITAPSDSIITGTVEQNSNILYQEQI